MKADYKQTPIDPIPKEWKVVDLGDFVEIEIGKRAKGGGLSKGAVASIGGEHVDGFGNIIWSDMKFIPEDFYDRLTQGKVRVRDVLIVKDGATTGKVAFVKNLPYPKVAVNEHVFIVRSRSESDLLNEFMFYFLFSHIGQSQIKRRFHGMIGGITREELKSLKIPLPPLPEQRKIAEILSTVDEAIQKVDEAIARTERLKRGLMRELLTKGIGHREFKDTEIGRIPKEWRMVKVEDVFEVYGGTTPSTTNEEYWNGDILWVTPTDVTNLNGKLELNETEKKITKKAVKDYSLRILPPGTLLLTSRATIGFTAINSKPVTINQGMAALIKRDGEDVDSTFYAYYFGLLKDYMAQLGGGSTFREVSKSTIKKLKIPLPPLPEQRRIAEILSTVDNKIEFERKRKEKLQRIKQGLMNVLLTGKKRVNIQR